MPDQAPSPTPKGRSRKTANVSLPLALLAEAAELKIDLSRACEAGVAAAVGQARRARWLEENREAFAFWNEDADKNGLPLDEYRQF